MASLQRLSDASESVYESLQRIQRSLNEEQPLLGDVQTVQVLSNEHRVCLCLSVCLSVSLSVSLSVCVSVCVFLTFINSVHSAHSDLFQFHITVNTSLVSLTQLFHCTTLHFNLSLLVSYPHVEATIDLLSPSNVFCPLHISSAHCSLSH